MITVEHVKSLIDSKLNGSDFFLVDLVILPGNKIRVSIDGMNGFPIEACVSFSRAIEHNLDREVEDFELEVSSPGLTKPFKVKEQYLKNIGRNIKVKTLEKGNFAGELREANDDGILLVYSEKEKVEGQKKKVEVEKKIAFNYSDLKEVKLSIEF
ncbi:MAG: ribosome assembly cofactor RimP [Flavobacteriales bacterium]|nr:ribosome assembly cofactor RimP [Flavobacteriales bacterium]